MPGSGIPFGLLEAGQVADEEDDVPGVDVGADGPFGLAGIEEHGDRFFRFERRHGSFARAVGLPAGVDESKIAASYVNGVLEVRVRKPEEARPRRIQLGTARGVIEDTRTSSDS